MKKSRAKTSEGKLKRIKRYAEGVFAISTKEISRRYRMTPRQALRYIDKLYNDGWLYMRYKVGPRYYYSVVRRKHETRKTQ
jgi:Mn-dependent DtxR family transcriptional regulator